MREFGFELSLCAHLEAAHDGIIARQLGSGVTRPGGRVMDIVHVQPGAAFDQRMALTPHRIPQSVIEAPTGAGKFRPATAVFDGPVDRVDRLVEAGVESGFLQRRRRKNQTEIKQSGRYPYDWFDGLVGIENKPTLARPGDLDRQLRMDVALGVFDYVVLATASHVTGAHLNQLPEPVGVWRYRNQDGVTVIREPTSLATETPGVEILTEQPGQTDIDIIAPEAKRRARRRIAERAVGKGWRTYTLPSCAQIRSGDRHGTTGLPQCAFFDRLVNPGVECQPDCPGFEEATAPTVDLAAERERRTPWQADSKTVRQQAGLDQFQQQGTDQSTESER